MPFYRMPNGNPVHINFGHKRNQTAPRPCAARRADGSFCAWLSGYQCDWKIETGTCDRYLCEAHAFEVSEEKHLCPEHVATYRGWLIEQGIAY